MKEDCFKEGTGRVKNVEGKQGVNARISTGYAKINMENMDGSYCTMLKRMHPLFLGVKTVDHRLNFFLIIITLLLFVAVVP